MEQEKELDIGQFVIINGEYSRVIDKIKFGDDIIYKAVPRPGYELFDYFPHNHLENLDKVIYTVSSKDAANDSDLADEYNHYFSYKTPEKESQNIDHFEKLREVDKDNLYAPDLDKEIRFSYDVNIFINKTSGIPLTEKNILLFLDEFRRLDESDQIEYLFYQLAKMASKFNK